MGFGNKVTDNISKAAEAAATAVAKAQAEQMEKLKGLLRTDAAAKKFAIDLAKRAGNDMKAYEELASFAASKGINVTVEQLDDAADEAMQAELRKPQPKKGGPRRGGGKGAALGMLLEALIGLLIGL